MHEANVTITITTTTHNNTQRCSLQCGSRHPQWMPFSCVDPYSSKGFRVACAYNCRGHSSNCPRNWSSSSGLLAVIDRPRDAPHERRVDGDEAWEVMSPREGSPLPRLHFAGDQWTQALGTLVKNEHVLAPQFGGHPHGARPSGYIPGVAGRSTGPMPKGAWLLPAQGTATQSSSAPPGSKLVRVAPHRQGCRGCVQGACRNPPVVPAPDAEDRRQGRRLGGDVPLLRNPATEKVRFCWGCKQ